MSYKLLQFLLIFFTVTIIFQQHPLVFAENESQIMMPRNVEDQKANSAAHYAIRDLRTFLEAYYQDNQRYPATYAEMVEKIPHAIRPHIRIQYWLISPKIVTTQVK